MFGLDGSAADVDGGAEQGFDAERIERDTGADDIGNGIGRADFVKMDLFYRDAVDGGFGFGEALKHSGGVMFRAGRDAGVVDHRQDVREMAMLLGLFTEKNAKFRGREAATAGFLDFETRAGGERFERVDDGGGRGSGVDERTDRHIAADAREGVEIADHALL